MFKLYCFTLLLLALFEAVLASSQECQYDIVESMPDKLVFNSSIAFKPTPTHEALIDMIDNTRGTLRIASFYLYLTTEPPFSEHPSAAPGKNIMDAIVRARKRNVSLELVVDASGKSSMSNQKDITEIENIGGTVRFLDMRKLLKNGRAHAKLAISDNTSFYLGSSNFDWRSYTQIKEIGIRFKECRALAEDLNKIFETYMMLADLGHIPDALPEYLNTEINIDKPFKLKLDTFSANLFLASSPPAFNGIKNWTGRTDDIDGLLEVINKAKASLDISVMNYSPRTEFIYPKKFWPRIDNALRRAASERNVRVRLLFSDWAHVKEEELMWYKSLNAVQSNALKGSIHVKMFKVPIYDDFERSIPFSRVKHDKYMISEDSLYLGTSNWTPDYFISTCGVGLVIRPQDETSSVPKQSIISNMQELFERDFSSEYSREL